MQRPYAGAVRGVGPVHLRRRFHGPGIDRQHGAQSRTAKIVGLDPVEIGPRQLRAGQTPGRKGLMHALNGRFLQMEGLGLLGVSGG